MNDAIWVVAFDKDTGIRAAFTVCPPANVEFYRAKYELEGYDVKVLTADEALRLAEDERRRGIL